MSKKEMSLALRTQGDMVVNKKELALQIAEKRFDELTMADQLGSSLIGYTIIPVRLFQVLSYLLCADAFAAWMMQMAPRFGVSLTTAIPVFILYLIMDSVVRGINREFVIKSKFKDEELLQLSLPCVYQAEVSKLVEAEIVPQIEQQVTDITGQLNKLEDDCDTLRAAYCELLSMPDLDEGDRALLPQLRDKMQTICRARTRFGRELRKIVQATEIEKSELKMVAIEGKVCELQMARGKKENVLALTDRLSSNLDDIKGEVDDLKAKLNLDLGLPQE